MQEVARGVYELRVSAHLALSKASLRSRTPPAQIGCLARSGLFGLDLPGHHLPVLAFFVPKQGDRVRLAFCLRRLQPENGNKIAAKLTCASFCSHFVEVIKSALGIADKLRGQTVGDLVKRERCLIAVLDRLEMLVV